VQSQTKSEQVNVKENESSYMKVLRH